jgi:hypothetical protein
MKIPHFGAIYIAKPEHGRELEQRLDDHDGPIGYLKELTGDDVFDPIVDQLTYSEYEDCLDSGILEPPQYDHGYLSDGSLMLVTNTDTQDFTENLDLDDIITRSTREQSKADHSLILENIPSEQTDALRRELTDRINGNEILRRLIAGTLGLDPKQEISPGKIHIPNKGKVFDTQLTKAVFEGRQIHYIG